MTLRQLTLYIAAYWVHIRRSPNLTRMGLFRMGDMNVLLCIPVHWWLPDKRYAKAPMCRRELAGDSGSNMKTNCATV
jgi:hypothetical protein